jgi:putative hydrolase of the HAD superfamily
MVNPFAFPTIAIFDLDQTLYDYKSADLKASQELISALSKFASIEKQEASSALSRARVQVKARLGKTASSHSRLLYITEGFRILKLRPDSRQFLNLEQIYCVLL